jgi:hypothetical protein
MGIAAPRMEEYGVDTEEHADICEAIQSLRVTGI